MVVRRKNSEGQALVLVLLALAVVLTIVLFILSRSITDISVSSSQSQSVSAFSAAEAGVEQALVIGSATGASTSVGVGGASYTTNVTNVASGATSFVFPLELNSGDNMTLWLKSQDSSSSFTGPNIKICWGSAGTSSSVDTTPAIEVVLFYETTDNDPATTKIYRAVVDPNSSRISSNSFTVAGGACNISGQSFAFSTTISGLTTLGTPQFAFVRMFYNTGTAQPIAFDSTDSTHTFPSQGIMVDSTGLAGQSTRRVSVFQSWPEIPDLFQFPIYSSTGITK